MERSAINGMQRSLSLPTKYETDETALQDADWLAAAAEFIQQDLDTAVKEFDLVRDVLERLEAGPDADRQQSPDLEDQKPLIAACREYSGSRCYMLEERLRQIRLWARDRHTGQDIPDGVPDEWPSVDVEWREWLNEQATSQMDESDAEVDGVVRHWGPLIPLLTAYTEESNV
ncbi:hypothetical protein GGR52DRAFT_435122 [Hypoxylon sp. FL1284]|nr:hypothetical protein GGR52DRAFT_435122 [Hypoxylon sp. FL1284]